MPTPFNFSDPQTFGSDDPFLQGLASRGRLGLDPFALARLEAMRAAAALEQEEAPKPRSKPQPQVPRPGRASGAGRSRRNIEAGTGRRAQLPEVEAGTGRMSQPQAGTVPQTGQRIPGAQQPPTPPDEAQIPSGAGSRTARALGLPTLGGMLSPESPEQAEVGKAPVGAVDVAPLGSPIPVQGSKVGDPVSAALPPHAKAFLNAVALGESPGGRYDMRFTAGGGAPFEGFNAHPGIAERIPEGFSAAGKVSTAAGRYQFTKTTWDRLGGGVFTPERQDEQAWRLAQNDYRRRTGRSLDKDLQQYGLNDQTLRALAPTWESLSSPRNRKQSISQYQSDLQRYGDEPHQVQVSEMDEQVGRRAHAAQETRRLRAAAQNDPAESAAQTAVYKNAGVELKPAAVDPETGLSWERMRLVAPKGEVVGGVLIHDPTSGKAVIALTTGTQQTHQTQMIPFPTRSLAMTSLQQLLAGPLTAQEILEAVQKANQQLGVEGDVEEWLTESMAERDPAGAEGATRMLQRDVAAGGMSPGEANRPLVRGGMRPASGQTGPVARGSAGAKRSHGMGRR